MIIREQTMSRSEDSIREQICEIGRRIYDRRMVAANDGNISVRISDHVFLCTPTGVSKGFMTPESICRVDEKGKLIDTGSSYRPSSEIKMHMRVYANRPDVGAVIHTHSTYATCFAVEGCPLNRPIMSEAVVSLGCVPLAPFATPSTNEVPESIEPYLNDFDSVLLENHGVLVWAEDLDLAWMKMESVEFYAELLYKSRPSGGAREFTKEEIDKLAEVRAKTGIKGRYPANRKSEVNCYKCDKCFWKDR